MELKDLYTLMFDTLLMIAADGIDLADEIVDDYLDEIEGDNHTFLHIVNVSKFTEAGLLTQQLSMSIIELRQCVADIAPEFWNVKSFRENEVWLTVHDWGSEILKQLQSPDTIWPMES